MSKILNFIKRLLQVSAFVYIALSVGVYFFQEHLIFNFAPVSTDHEYKYSVPHEFITIDVNKETSLHGVKFQAGRVVSKEVVLYFKGNAGNIGRSQKMAKTFLRLGYDVISMDYRGFGKSRGDLNEAAMLRDALRWYAYAQKHYGKRNVRVAAWSMGGAFASHVAARTNVKNVVIFAPFKSIIDMGYRRFPYFKHEWFASFPFRNDLRLASVKNKRIVIYHGTADRVVPYASGKGLYESSNKQAVEFIRIKGANHYTVPWHNMVISDINRRWFVKGLQLESKIMTRFENNT